MVETFTTPENYEQFKENHVEFITFNYDRSLEYFIYESFINSFSSQRLDDDIRAALHKNIELIPFPFCHIYGKIADLPWQSEDGVEYGYNGVQRLSRFSANIRVIFDRNQNHDDLVKAKKLIIDAKRIFFLGFGYAKENLEILGLPANLNSKQEIYGTALGMTDKEINDLKRSIFLNSSGNKPTIPAEIFVQEEKIKIGKLDCLQLLREYL